MVIYVAIVFVSLLIPMEKADVSKLQPVEAATVCQKNGKTEIYTDTGAWGSGRNAQEALEDLICNTQGIVYLDTAKYLMVDKDSLDQIEWLRDELKGSVKLCMWNCDDDIREAVKYFSVHDDLPKIKDWTLGEKLPEYISEKH